MWFLTQEEIRHQVEEKQRQRKEERLRKLREEAEEEAKFRAEKTNAQREVQQVKEMNRLKEVSSGHVYNIVDSNRTKIDIYVLVLTIVSNYLHCIITMII